MNAKDVKGTVQQIKVPCQNYALEVEKTARVVIKRVPKYITEKEVKGKRNRNNQK